MIVSLNGSYHGWHSSASGGVQVEANDAQALQSLMAANDDIAAVIIEPMMANAGCIRLTEDYLTEVGRLVKQYGCLLIADEVLMGFRICKGLAAHALGLRPDLATMGKAIGSGFAVSAVAGTPEVMEVFNTGRLRSAGTYNGNPVAASAVLATMQILTDACYDRLLAVGDSFRSKIEHAARNAGLDLSTSGYGDLYTIRFTRSSPDTYQDALRLQNKEASMKLHRMLRQRGVLVMPDPHGRIVTSMAHTDAVLDEALECFADVFQNW